MTTPAAPARRHVVPCIGGPLHMRTVQMPDENGHPSQHLAATAYPAPGHAHLTEDGRVLGSLLDSDRDIVNYTLGVARADDARSLPAAYRFNGTDRESWGWHNDIRDLDESIGLPERLGDDIAWVLDWAWHPQMRERRDRWTLVLPPFDAMTVTVYRTLPVVHETGILTAAIMLRPRFPMWLDERYPR